MAWIPGVAVFLSFTAVCTCFPHRAFISMIQAFRGLQDIGCLPHAPLNFYALNSRLFFVWPSGFLSGFIWMVAPSV